MKIGLLGFGKMGKTIESLAIENGDEIVWKITSKNAHELTRDLLRQAEVVIEFTRPESGFENVMRCLEAKIPVVSGTTGWQKDLPTAQKFCLENGGAMIWASNFSVGVNLFFILNKYLAKLMSTRPEYGISMTEIHHLQKLDAPSGTAVSLAEGIFQEIRNKNGWKLHPEMPSENEISIEAVRKDGVPGTHEILWTSEIDEITICHVAKNRKGFASGALLAARWLVGKRGVFSMENVLFGGMRDEE